MEHNQSAGRREALAGILRSHPAWLAAVPVVLVNYVAFSAQLGFWRDHLALVNAVLVSAALESIAVYWTWLAHQAMVADDSALRPRLAAYGMALLIGVLNYSHYMRPGWRPTVAAVTFGMMSVISPWLWAGYSRRVSRPALVANELIEKHAARLGITRRFWHPVLSTRVTARAAWLGENRPAEAIRLVDPPKWVRTPQAPGAAAVAADPGKPPLVPEARDLRIAAAVRADGEPGLAAARNRQTEQELVRDLIRQGYPLPGRNQLSRDKRLPGSDATRKRAARDILIEARKALDGADGHVNGSRG